MGGGSLLIGGMQILVNVCDSSPDLLPKISSGGGECKGGRGISGKLFTCSLPGPLGLFFWNRTVSFHFIHNPSPPPYGEGSSSKMLFHISLPLHIRVALFCDWTSKLRLHCSRHCILFSFKWVEMITWIRPNKTFDFVLGSYLSCLYFGSSQIFVESVTLSLTTTYFRKMVSVCSCLIPGVK